MEGFCASGLSNLTYLGLRRSSAINAEGMRAFSSLINLEKLDLDRCPGIHGGLAHLKGFGSITYPDCTRGKIIPLYFLCLSNPSKAYIYIAYWFQHLPFLCSDLEMENLIF